MQTNFCLDLSVKRPSDRLPVRQQSENDQGSYETALLQSGHIAHWPFLRLESIVL